MQNEQIVDDTNNYIQRERKAIIYAVIAQFIWAIGVIIIKAGNKCTNFTPNSYSMWRSVFMSLITYYTLKQKNIPIIPFSQVKRKYWFLVRTLGTYFCFLFYIISLVYLRAATASCLDSSAPLIIIFLSAWLLKEKIYMRYIIGIILCFIGSAMIVLNDKKSGSASLPVDDKEDSNTIIAKGIFFSMLNVIMYSLITFAQKLMVMDGLSTEIQIFYTGTSNFVLGFAFCLYEGNFGLNIWLIIITFGNGLVFYYGQLFTDLTLKNMDVSKFSPTTYIQAIFVFILGFLIFGETFFVTDLIGSLLIVIFHIYNWYRPIKSTTVQ